ncbi:MAG: 23S rRNA (guanosine(2251)-2'-O)-methyltransferase RlmB [Clostridia bacterium]|nr:23S rRNA (guanosine(2251)-2'-O)-methyltransferase RlmB [Clostridia bacterium]
MKTEGRNAVLELLRSEKPVEKIIMEKDPQGSLKLIYSMAREMGVPVRFEDKTALDRQSVTGRHQGVIAFSADYEYCDLQDIMQSKSPGGGFVILCDGIEDVHNLGSIIRVAECAGADGVVIPSIKSASVTEAVIRISAGAANHVKVAKVPSLNYAIEILQKGGYWVYALEADGEDIYKQDFTGNVALVIGGEDSGVKRLTRERCDKVVSIPLMGKVNSLNASVACGIAAYEVVRCRRS